MSRLCLLSVAFAASVSGNAAWGDEPALEVFQQRIMPIFRSTDPSSCVQCHLASVDIKDYILPSHEQTFVSLRDQGLIDLQDPPNSKILQLIQMGEKDLDEGAKLIHQKTRQAEYAAFAAWISACCSDPQLRDLPPLDEVQRARPEVADEVIRHTRKSRVLDSFVRNIWSHRLRCFPCHTPAEIDADDPRHQAAVKKQQEFAAQYPALMPRLHIFHETPEATLQSLIDKSRSTPDGQLPLINLDDPRRSLLILKPMSKLPPKDENGEFADPSSVEPVSHMGGLKMHPNDPAYKSFVNWIQDYSRVVGGTYTSVAELPTDNWQPTPLVLKLTAAPDDWPTGTPVQLFVHPRQADSESWTTHPVAFTQGTITPKRVVNGTLILLTDDNGGELRNDPAPATLPRGDYLVKVYVDRRGRLADDPARLLSEDDYVGQAELKRARWREGFRFAEAIAADDLVQESSGDSEVEDLSGESR